MTEMVERAQRGSNGRFRHYPVFPDGFIKDRLDVSSNGLRCIRLLTLLPVESSKGSLHWGEMLYWGSRTVPLHKLYCYNRKRWRLCVFIECNYC